MPKVIDDAIHNFEGDCAAFDCNAVDAEYDALRCSSESTSTSASSSTPRSSRGSESESSKTLVLSVAVPLGVVLLIVGAVVSKVAYSRGTKYGRMESSHKYVSRAVYNNAVYENPDGAKTVYDLERDTLAGAKHSMV